MACLAPARSGVTPRPPLLGAGLPRVRLSYAGPEVQGWRRTADGRARSLGRVGAVPDRASPAARRRGAATLAPVAGVVAPPFAGSSCRPSLRVAALSRWGGVSWPASSMKSLRKETLSEMLVSASGKQYPVPRGRTAPCPTALLISLLRGVPAEGRNRARPCRQDTGAPWLCGCGSRA